VIHRTSGIRVQQTEHNLVQSRSEAELDGKEGSCSSSFC